MTCEKKKIDTNSTGLAYSEETCLGELPLMSPFQAVEVNSYSDFGGELSTVTREPISMSRQNKKGAVTGISVAAGFTTDFTQNNMTDLLQGVFFADKREQPMLAVTGVTSDGYTVGSKGTDFKENDLILATDFDLEANNGLKVVGTGTTDTEIKVAGLTTESKGGHVHIVGHKFASDDLSITATGNICTMTSKTVSFKDLKLERGQWLFIGGDDDATQFAKAKTGYARIGEISDDGKTLTFDDMSLTLVTDDGAGKTIEVFYGTVIRNEYDPTLIKRRSYTLERTLGNNDSGKPQSEYVSGAVIDELKVNIPQGGKVTAELTFKATNHEFRNGEVGHEPLSTGRIVPALGEPAINTTSDVRRLRVIINDGTSTSKPLFAYLTELSLSFKNNLSENKAIGVFGAIDISMGNFVASASCEAYFANTAAPQAVRDNANVGMSTIFAADNAGFIFDIPLVSLGGGKVKADKDNPLMISIEANGAENAYGWTAAYTNFAYLPTVAM